MTLSDDNVSIAPLGLPFIQNRNPGDFNDPSPCRKKGHENDGSNLISDAYTLAISEYPTVLSALVSLFQSCIQLIYFHTYITYLNYEFY